MKHIVLGSGILVSTLTFSSISWAVTVTDVPNPRHSNVWVTDMANMIDPALELKLNALIDAAHSELTIEIAVVTVDKVDSATPKDFATELFNHWGIGHRTTNNGLLVLMVKDERRLEMETGYGLEPILTDGWLKAMQGGEMVPRFKRSEFGEGIFNGVSLSIDRVRGNRDGIVAAGDLYDHASSDTDHGDVPLLPFGLLGGGGIIAAAKSRYKHRKDRTCHTCKKKMQMLPEKQDDQHLSAGQLREEQLGSIDWQYYYCDSCGHHRLLKVSRWFSGYQACRKCAYKTSQASEQVLSSATYSSSGTARVTEQCKHCGNQHVYHKTLPRLERSSSSSSGSSFGGGSSGGGGSGSSW